MSTLGGKRALQTGHCGTSGSRTEGAEAAVSAGALGGGEVGCWGSDAERGI